MKRYRFGLRFEIVSGLSLLLAAALLFVGFLLVKLSERHLLAQRVRGAKGVASSIASMLSRQNAKEPYRKSISVEQVRALVADIGEDAGISDWAIFGPDLDLVGARNERTADKSDLTALQHVWAGQESLVNVRYGVGLLTGPQDGNFVAVTTPVKRYGGFAGAVQVWFSLSGVSDQLAVARRLTLIYAIGYGAVLVFFGSLMLGRLVVKPAKDLMLATNRIAEGNLDCKLPTQGPVEIAQLADHFNVMVAALKTSRQKTERTIASLRAANEEVRRAQQELLRSERLASVGHLAAGMAHEIGNPLGAVVGYLELLKDDLDDAGGKNLAERSLAELGRIDRLVRDLLDYATPTAEEAEVVDPWIVLREAESLLIQQGALEGIRFEHQLSSSLSPVCISRHKLFQVFVNLLLNARDAISGGGTVRLAAGTEAKVVWLAVADEGCGMDPERVRHIFDPFYTTKAPDRGRGLGLAVCHRIVEEAGGRIEVDSRPGAGSTFTVCLPMNLKGEHER